MLSPILNYHLAQKNDEEGQKKDAQHENQMSNRLQIESMDVQPSTSAGYGKKNIISLPMIICD